MPSRTPETDKQTHEKESEPCIRDFANTDASTSAPLSRLSLAFAQLLDTLLARIASLAALLSSPAYAPVNEITDRTTPITTPAPSMSSIISATTKTVVVLGCAYGGESFLFVFSAAHFFYASFILSIKYFAGYFGPHRLPAFLRVSLAYSCFSFNQILLVPPRLFAGTIFLPLFLRTSVRYTAHFTRDCRAFRHVV
jgi:hypothetical protein